jgi:peptidoglycan/LPS O-acetylase OafA/YrhL
MINTKAKANYLDVLQILRGFAALMIVVHHSAGSFKFYHKINYQWLEFIGGLGKFGVDFFFVLSGFIISYSAFYKYNLPNAFLNYTKNRLVRIYVPYLPIGIFILVLYTCFPSFSNGNRSISTISSLTLLPFGNPALSVAWTLSFELCFYFLFSISFFSKKVWNCFLVLWLVIILYFNYFSQIAIPNLFLKLLFSTYNIEFMLGYFLSILIIKKIKINFSFGFLILILLSAILLHGRYYSTEPFAFSFNFVFALIAFIIIYLAIIFYDKKVKNTNILMFIGNATYSIYLIHNPLQMLLIRILPKINSEIATFLNLILTLFVCSFFGHLYYLIFEKKIMRMIMAKITN